MSFGSRLSSRRKELGIKQIDLANILCVSQSAIASWETDANSPRATLLYKVFEILKCDANYLFQDEMAELRQIESKDGAEVFSESEVELIRQYRALDTARKNFVSNIIRREVEQMRLVEDMRAQAKSTNGKTLRAITYYGKLAAAGHAIDSFSDLMQGTIEVPDSPAARSADFAIGVLGDSMEPTFYDGDIVLVKKIDEIRPGEIGIFQIGNGIYIKELTRDCLVSHNPKYAPIRSEESVMGIGVVLGKIEQ